MKTAIIITAAIIIFIIFGLIFSEGTVDVLSDVSGVMFMIFALSLMLLIGTAIAIEMAKHLQLEMLEKELYTLKREKYFLESENIFYIEFTEEAIAFQNSLRAIEGKISKVQESTYESI